MGMKFSVFFSWIQIDGRNLKKIFRAPSGQTLGDLGWKDPWRNMKKAKY